MKFDEMNDLELKKWKKYSEEEVRTDSLWILGRRGEGGKPPSEYHGAFIPQIPEQMILRYTKEGETVWDVMAGSGTTGDVAKKLGRECVMMDINPLRGDIIKSDACFGYPPHNVQLIIFHPPYWDIIKYSNNNRDLCNASSLDEYMSMFGMAVDNVSKYLDDGRMLVLVIGDCYRRGEWIPLGFLTMNRVMHRDYKLKGIVVKNISGNERAKGKSNRLWRYRALKGGFYIFKHEYVMIFQKKHL